MSAADYNNQIRLFIILLVPIIVLLPPVIHCMKSKGHSITYYISCNWMGHETAIIVDKELLVL